MWSLEQRVTGGHMGQPGEFLKELFQARHGLLAARTMGALGAEVFGRITALGDRIRAADLRLVTDVLDQLSRIRGLGHRHARPTEPDLRAGRRRMTAGSHMLEPI